MAQIEKAFKEDMKNYNQQTVSNPVEAVVSDDFSLLLMWNEKNMQDMWYVERLVEKEGKPDYYGPFFHKWNAEKFKNNEL